MDLKSTYNKIANDWFRDHQDDNWWLEGTTKFLSLLPKDATILDIGCGGGLKSKYLFDKGFKVTGMDFSEGMIDIAKREFPEIDFLVGDIYELDSYQKKFDAVFAQAVLLHIPKDRINEALNKLKNKLNPNGVLYIAVKETKIDQPDHENRIENDYGYEYERFFSYFTLPEIKESIEKLDMKLIFDSVTTAGKTNWIQVIAKNIS
ncbi:MAG: class I SAM-dependent methyltransferase [Candidatus Zambryskibacteria bacterium]|nr:class I SAM-dependent methyltransferase [Candidatus Zambryskibacteria bacterium]